MPIRTMVCTCPEGYVTDENGGCRTLPPIVSGCERDDECNDQTACINAVCRDPCGCGLNARCDIVEHRPVCICEPGFYGKLISLIYDFQLFHIIFQDKNIWSKLKVIKIFGESLF